ncbi:MAG: LysE family translocator [Alphaproteobacteria bacterium]|nr:LysE family translocator [Alphaproteobacteria bacterium]
MVDAGLLLAFTLAAVFVLMMPGPTVLTVVSYGLRLGPRAAGASTAGVVLGDGLAVTLCLTGAGAVLAVSPLAFGIWRTSNAPDAALNLDLRTAPGLHPGADATHAAADRAAQTDLAKVFRQTFMVTTLNPKGIAFFLAFIPQFVAADRPYWGQVTVYGLLFVGLGGLNALAYAYFSGRLAFVFDRPGPVRILRRVSAGFLLFAALITAAGHVPTL